MRLHRITARNFCSFANFDVITGRDLVIIGENKVGKSNLIYALRLLLDPSLSDRDRDLTLEDFWDGLGDHKVGATVEVSIELTDFDGDARLLAHLGDCLITTTSPFIARLTYQFRPKRILDRQPVGLSDYEWCMFGGVRDDLRLQPGVRHMLRLDVLDALRDSEYELSNWRRSPLRPLIDSFAAHLTPEIRVELVERIDAAHRELSTQSEVSDIARRVTDRLRELAGPHFGTVVELGVTPRRLDSLLRELRLLIDGGARGISDASLGTANLIYLALKSLEMELLAAEGERDHTFLAVEEPEAHLHPHLQRLVYRYFLGDSDAAGESSHRSGQLTTILTTHSPHIASIAPIRSLVLLRRDHDKEATIGVSCAGVALDDYEIRDLQRYLDVTRGEILFARGVVLVEGDAERFLVPAFAEAMGIQLDALGISICSVAGTNFGPYGKLLDTKSLGIPYVILTDRDLVTDSPPQARARVLRLLELTDPETKRDELTDEVLFTAAEARGIFVGLETLEADLFRSGLGEKMSQILATELSQRQSTVVEVRRWVNDPSTLNRDRLLSMIEDLGKGRFAQLLAPYVTAQTCPDYVRKALESIATAVN